VVAGPSQAADRMNLGRPMVAAAMDPDHPRAADRTNHDPSTVVHATDLEHRSVEADADVAAVGQDLRSYGMRPLLVLNGICAHFQAL
jgi:hypothetical protein